MVGWRIHKYEIMEISLVSVPSNVDGAVTAASRSKLTNPIIKGWAEGLAAKRKKSVAPGLDLKEVVVKVKADTTEFDQALARIAGVKTRECKDAGGAAPPKDLATDGQKGVDAAPVDDVATLAVKLAAKLLTGEKLAAGVLATLRETIAEAEEAGQRESLAALVG